MAEVYLPSTLPPLFPGLPRKLELDASSVDEAIRRLDERWPGFRDRAFGVAFDIGSTTIAGHLASLLDGSVLASAGVMNPQIRFGEDLMSRVSYSMMHADGAEQMTHAVREALSALAADVASLALAIGQDQAAMAKNHADQADQRAAAVAEQLRRSGRLQLGNDVGDALVRPAAVVVLVAEVDVPRHAVHRVAQQREPAVQGVVGVRGRWVEVDREKLAKMLDQFRAVEKAAAETGVTLADAMRMLAGAAEPDSGEVQLRRGALVAEQGLG